MGCLRDAVVLIDGEVGYCSEEDNSNCIVDDSLSEQNCIKNGVLIRLDMVGATLIKDIAATVSVAQRTQLTNMISLRSRVLKMRESIAVQNRQRLTKPMMVPITPKKVIIPKFSKKSDFLSEYPAEKMIGGKMIVKKISLSNTISASRP